MDMKEIALRACFAIYLGSIIAIPVMSILDISYEMANKITNFIAIVCVVAIPIFGACLIY